jgi:hypothetical protein
MIPKLKIVYSGIYDEMLHAYHRKSYTKQARIAGERYARALQRKCDRIMPRAFQTMASISGLRWRERVIWGYVVRYLRHPGISHPLTLRMNQNWQGQIELLIHELAHQLIVQNLDKSRFKQSWIWRKYKNENPRTLWHIPVHAILKLTLSKLFGTKATARHIAKYKLADYKRAWQIVEIEGAEKLIKGAFRH